jgi:rhodanese-related sulfurtransferase
MRRLHAITLASAIAITYLSTAALVARAAEDKAAPDITIKDLKKAIEDKTVTVIDANGSDSFKSGHIPTAIDYEANAEKLKEVLPKDKDALIVAYCGGPQCDAYKAAAKAAVAMGYTNVKHLSAGISGWKSAGEKVDKEG